MAERGSLIIPFEYKGNPHRPAILATLERDTTRGEMKYFIPGESVRRGESAQHAAWRAGWEELGLDFDEGSLRHLATFQGSRGPNQIYLATRSPQGKLVVNRYGKVEVYGIAPIGIGGAQNEIPPHFRTGALAWLISHIHGVSRNSPELTLPGAPAVDLRRGQLDVRIPGGYFKPGGRLPHVHSRVHSWEEQRVNWKRLGSDSRRWI